MKKFLCLTLVLILLAGLSGCRSGNDIIEAVEFFYPWADLVTVMENDPDCASIGSEFREASGHTGDLIYLLSLYLRGPLDGDLRSPFPTGCKLVSVSRADNTLYVTLDSTFARLEGMDLTMACSCLARTCFGLTSVGQVQILTITPDGDALVTMTIGAESLLLEDDGSAIPQQATEETQ